MTGAARIAALALVFASAGCSNSAGGSAADHYRRAEAALAAGEPRTARVELLNAIKADPSSRAARLLQAQVYLALRDGPAAEAEIMRARQLGVAPAHTGHLMAHAHLLQGRPDQALQEASAPGQSDPPYAARMRGQALMALDDGAGAGAAFAEALERAPDDVQAWVDMARYRRWNGDLGGAVAAADEAVKRDAESADALVLRGELTRGQYGLRAAIPWFDRALAIDPEDVTALLERAATYGEIGATRAMLADTRAAQEVDPVNAMAYYLQAMLAARARDFDLAHAILERTGGRLDDNPAAMLLSGVIDVQTGSVERGAERLARLVAMQPDNASARRLLAVAQWRRGDVEATIEAIRPLADADDADTYALSLMGQALKKRGDARTAAYYLARAAAPRQADGAAPLGIAADDEALQALRYRADKEGTADRQVALIRALIARGLGDEALERARRLQASNPGVPDAHLLVGDALGTRADFAGAAEAYRKAANLAFTEPVAMRLVEALERSNQGATAGEVLSLFLGQNPRNVAAQSLAAGRAMASKDWDGAIRLYEGLRERLGNRDSAMLNNLAWAYAQKQDWRRALPIAEQAWRLDRDSPATTDTLGWILFRSGKDKARGLALLAQAARGAPSDAEILARLETARRG